ncbi:unnamed protein product [Anisakis simplex]|uniref:GRIP domain-containing protein n=1 Tax=Anisakis simplex TaxID=6269 RepID=A0A158PN28_ANISI|nr:unnamed protein product [Anisakis simplex]
MASIVTVAVTYIRSNLCWFSDERLRIKALYAKIRSLEEDNASLQAKSDELQLELNRVEQNDHNNSVHDNNVSSSSEEDDKSIRLQQSRLIETLTASLQESESKLIEYEEKLLNLRRVEAATNDNERKEGNEVDVTLMNDQKSEVMIESMRTELSAMKESLEKASDRIQHMECVNFELQRELKETKSELMLAENRAKETDEQFLELSKEKQRSFEEQKRRIDELMEISVESEMNFKNQVNTISEMESETIILRDRLRRMEEELCSVKDEANKNRKELENAKLAMSEMEAVDNEVQALKQQLDIEKESLASEWTKVRSMLVSNNEERKRENDENEMTEIKITNNGSSVSESEGGHLDNEISDHTQTADNQEELLMMVGGVETLLVGRESSSGLKNCEKVVENRDENVEDSEQFAWGDDDGIVDGLVNDRQSSEVQLTTGINATQVGDDQEEEGVVNEASKSDIELENERKCLALLNDIQYAVDETHRLEAIIEEYRNEREQLIHELNQYKNEREQHPIPPMSLSSQQEQQLQLQAQNDDPSQSAVSPKVDVDNGSSPEDVHHQIDAVTTTSISCSSSNESAVIDEENQSTNTAIGSSTKEEGEQFLVKENGSTLNAQMRLMGRENALLREHAVENLSAQDNLIEDVHHLMVLNNELETAVDALKGELWALNSQLKASLSDRECLTAQLYKVTKERENEREEARQRERQLEDQKDMAERSQRQAALAENESNCRLMEWQEKSTKMEMRCEEVESAYKLLTTYYQQLQEAYNALYARFCVAKSDTATETDVNVDRVSEQNINNAESCIMTTSNVNSSDDDRADSQQHHTLDDQQLDSFSQSSRSCDENYYNMKRTQIDRLKTELATREMQLNNSNTQLKQLRELAVTELATLRRSVLQIRTEEIARLKLAITESIAETACGLKAIYERAVEIVADVEQVQNARYADNISAIRELLNEAFKDDDEACYSATHLNEAIFDSRNLTSTLEMIKEKLIHKQAVINETREALSELRNTCCALESKLQQAEAEKVDKQYTSELEQLLETTQVLLTRHVDKCQRLQERVELLEHEGESKKCVEEQEEIKTDDESIDEGTTTPFCSLMNDSSMKRKLTKNEEEKSDVVKLPQRREEDITGEDGDMMMTDKGVKKCVYSDSNRSTKANNMMNDCCCNSAHDSEMAILAARLTTKRVDNDALFRCNAELAHTNVRLQNEMDELKMQLEEKQQKISTLMRMVPSEVQLSEENNEDADEIIVETVQRCDTNCLYSEWKSDSERRKINGDVPEQEEDVGMRKGDDIKNITGRDNETMLISEERLIDEETLVGSLMTEKQMLKDQIVELNAKLNGVSTMYENEKKQREYLEVQLNDYMQFTCDNKVREQLAVEGENEKCFKIAPAKIDSEVVKKSEVEQDGEEKSEEATNREEDWSDGWGWGESDEVAVDETEPLSEVVREPSSQSEVIKDVSSMSVESGYQSNSRLIDELKKENVHLQEIERSLRARLTYLENGLDAAEEYAFKMDEKNEQLEAKILELRAVIDHLENNQSDRNADKSVVESDDNGRLQNITAVSGFKTFVCAEQPTTSEASSDMLIQDLRKEISKLRKENVDLNKRLMDDDAEFWGEYEKEENGVFMKKIAHDQRQQSNQTRSLGQQTEVEGLTQESSLIGINDEDKINNNGSDVIIDELKEQQNTQCEIISKLNEQLASANKRNLDYKNEVESLIQELSKNSVKVSEMNNVVMLTKNKVEQLEKALESAKKQNELLKDSEVRLMDSTTRYEEAISELEVENQQLTNDLKIVKKQLADQGVSNAAECNKLVEQYERLLEEASIELKSVNSELDKERTAKDKPKATYDASVQIEIINDESLDNVAEVAENVSDLQAVMQQNQQLLAKMETIESERKRMCIEKKQLLKRIKIMKSELDAYKEENEMNVQRSRLNSTNSSSSMLSVDGCTKLSSHPAQTISNAVHASDSHHHVVPSCVNQTDDCDDDPAFVNSDLSLDATIHQIHATSSTFKLEVRRLDNLRNSFEQCERQIKTQLETLLTAVGDEEMLTMKTGSCAMETLIDDGDNKACSLREDSFSVAHRSSKLDEQSSKSIRTDDGLSLRVTELENENRKLHLQLEEERLQHNSLAERRVCMLETENLKLEARLDELRTEADAMEVENAELRSSLATSRRTERCEVQRLTVELDELRMQLNVNASKSMVDVEVLKSRVKELEDENGRLRTDAKDVRDSMQRLIAQLQSENKRLEGVMGDNYRIVKNNNMTEEKKENLLKMLNDAMVRNRELELEIGTLCENSTKLEENLRQKQDETVRLETAIKNTSEMSETENDQVDGGNDCDAPYSTDPEVKTMSHCERTELKSEVMKKHSEKKVVTEQVLMEPTVCSDVLSVQEVTDEIVSAANASDVRCVLISHQKFSDTNNSERSESCEHLCEEDCSLSNRSLRIPMMSPTRCECGSQSLKDLLCAHEKIADYVAELENRVKWQRLLEDAYRSLQMQNNKYAITLLFLNLFLSTQQSLTVFASSSLSNEQTDQMKALEVKSMELEQSHETQERLIDELRIAEAKLLMVDDTVRDDESRIEQLQGSVNEWRKRFEEVSQENETLQRANEEVQNLERVINEINTEKENCYQQVYREKRQLIASRDHLSDRLNEANAHIEILQQKLMRTLEARTSGTVRIVEMEADMRRLNARIAELERINISADNSAVGFDDRIAELNAQNFKLKKQIEELKLIGSNQEGGSCAETSSVVHLVVDETVESPSDDVVVLQSKLDKVLGSKRNDPEWSISTDELSIAKTNRPVNNDVKDNSSVLINELRERITVLSEQLISAQETIEMLNERSSSTHVPLDESESDFHNNSTELIPANNPWPRLIIRLRRLFRWMPHRRRALLPYFRYALLAYFVFLHIAFFHCFFF